MNDREALVERIQSAIRDAVDSAGGPHLHLTEIQEAARAALAVVEAEQSAMDRLEAYHAFVDTIGGTISREQLIALNVFLKARDADKETVPQLVAEAREALPVYFVLDGVISRNGQDITSQEESDAITDAFLKWVEARGLAYGGLIGIPSRVAAPTQEAQP